MSLRWLKQYMPRSLYTRAALILVLPVVVVQFVVSFAFIGLHLKDVTTQMTLTVVRELRLVSDLVAEDTEPDTALRRAATVTEPLRIRLRFPDAGEVPGGDRYRWFDFSGRVVARTFRNALPGTRALIFPDNRDVLLYLDTRFGVVEITFGRWRVSVAAPHQLIATMVAFGGLMTVVAFVYLRNQLRPIRRLADAAQAFGRGRSVPYAPRGAVEVRIAGNAFVDMRARIERHIEQRTLMLSGVSHDMRTPLTRLKLGLSMLDDRDAEPLLRDVDELQRLLDAFLDFARDAMDAEAEMRDPFALVRGVVEDARRGGKRVEIGEMTGSGELSLRPVAIRRAVENLIGNAVRYGGQAVVSVSLSDKALRIRVEDDGPGIPPELREEAVKPFSRLDPARNQDLGAGVGLGLAIVNDVARMHGGALRLGQSEALGGLRADLVIGR